MNSANPSIPSTISALINRINANPLNSGVGHHWPVSTRTLINPVISNPATKA
ncbi:hypothetical protein D1872_311380 [compost metagenome]